MDYKELELLAERFWQGETSEQEEDKLRQAVLYGAIPPALEELREYFQMTEELKTEQQLGELFDKQLMQEVERRESGGSVRGHYFLKMAAGLAIVLGMFFLIKGPVEPDQPIQGQDALVITDTYEDPEVAYQEVRKALLLVGKNMNEGLSYTGSIGEFDKAKGQIRKEDNRDADRTDK